MFTNTEWASDVSKKIISKMEVVAARNKEAVPYTTDSNGRYEDASYMGWWTNGFYGGICWELYNILSYNFTPTNESIGYLKMGSKILDTFGARCLVMLGCIYADEGDKENQIKCLQQATRLGSYEAQTKIQSIKNRSYSAHNTTQSAKSGGCYVATCIYGSYDCPQVWTLRRFRDNTLAETMFGRAFIHTYYAISPTLVKWFGNTSWFKKMWKVPLDRMVSVLQKNGFEDTPYKDKNWK